MIAGHFPKCFIKVMVQLSSVFSVWQDDSRKAASELFPSLSSLLKRKKDHGTTLLLIEQSAIHCFILFCQSYHCIEML